MERSPIIPTEDASITLDLGGGVDVCSLLDHQNDDLGVPCLSS
eukprot:CAMPEP_0206280604 /NCGR_PEP_ID=MMETSP0047_2-20121206/38670_1 /ASSEMBLY_ACC=CAM_ASM_000192 /TAXON_ID=195065 /ORGANISM="Chroomonas mesostigmatica_cf, Strain CCMP1168" /LENGTH=42 /DNA_ID= /DNA_START= /DNA_END= /DNA_ORIENTATION=